MAEYTLRCIDGPKFTRWKLFSAEDDDTAIDQCRWLRDAQAAELWQGTRKIRVFELGPTALD